MLPSCRPSSNPRPPGCSFQASARAPMPIIRMDFYTRSRRVGVRLRGSIFPCVRIDWGSGLEAGPCGPSRRR
jgi:hypothetical protein